MRRKAGGAKVIFVDPYFHQSAQAIGDEWIPCRPGTDGALLEALAYEMIVNDWQDQEFLDTYCLGFDADHMPPDAKTEENFKDYILGAYDGIPKTPERASAICGTPVETIKSFAREISTTKPMAWKSSGRTGAHLLRKPLRPAVLHGWLDDGQRWRARRRNIGRGLPTRTANWARRAAWVWFRSAVRATSMSRIPFARSRVRAARFKTANTIPTKNTAFPSRRRSSRCRGGVFRSRATGRKKGVRHPVHRARHHPPAPQTSKAAAFTSNPPSARRRSSSFSSKIVTGARCQIRRHLVAGHDYPGGGAELLCLSGTGRDLPGRASCYRAVLRVEIRPGSVFHAVRQVGHWRRRRPRMTTKQAEFKKILGAPFCRKTDRAHLW